MDKAGEPSPSASTKASTIMLSASGRRSLRRQTCEQRLQTTGAIERNQIVVTAHMGFADENLRHRGALGARTHLCSLFRVGIHSDFFDFDMSAFEKSLGRNAVGAKTRGVHHDFVHAITVVEAQDSLLSLDHWFTAS